MTNLKIGFSNDLRQISIVTRYEMLKHLRSKKLLTFAIITMAILVLITAIYLGSAAGFPEDPKEFMSSYVSLLFLFLIIGVSMFCASAIASEFDERTALLIFPRPMKRISLFIGKALASFIVIGIVILLYYSISMVLCLAKTGSVPASAFASMGMAMLFVLGAGGFALLMSTVFKKGLIAVIVTLLVLLLVMWFIVDLMVGPILNIEPVFSVTYGSGGITNVINGFVSYSETFEIEGMGSVTTSTFFPSNVTAIAIMSIYAIITTTLAALLFSRKEF